MNTICLNHMVQTNNNKKTIKKRIKRDNINGTKYMEAARSAASMYLAAREARRHLYVVSFDSFVYCLFDCLFHCGADFFRRELCHNGTGVRHGSLAPERQVQGVWGAGSPQGMLNMTSFMYFNHNLI